MKGGGKPGLNVRRKTALEGLIKRLEEFKKAGKDYQRKDKKHPDQIKTRPYAQEVARMEREIEILKSRIYN
jgi:hypothetical protein